MTWKSEFNKVLTAFMGDYTQDSNDESDEEVNLSKLPICPYCGGYHIYTCPRVRKIAYYPPITGPDGSVRESIQEITFDRAISDQLWEDVKWP